MMKLSYDEINERLDKAYISKERGYDAQAITDLNKEGIVFTFTPYGVSWKYAD